MTDETQATPQAATGQETPKVQETEAKGLVDKAYLAAERLELANKRTAELLERQEQVLAKQMLSGRADAGMVIKSPEEMQKEKIKEDVAKAIKTYYG